MNTYRVYHIDWTSNENVREAYEIVAFVEAEDLDAAFRDTNTIENYWWENENVTEIVDKTRSTSVGDIIVEDETGIAYTVDMFGFSVNKWFK